MSAPLPRHAEITAAAHDREFICHCLFITSNILLTLVLCLGMGPEGSLLAGILSPVTMYGQEIADAINRVKR
jgi:hypothetical protein